MKTVIEGRHYKLGEFCLVAHKSERGYWAFYLLDHPEEPVFILRKGLFFCSPLNRVDPGCRYIIEDLEKVWTLEELVEGRES